VPLPLEAIAAVVRRTQSCWEGYSGQR
jgi:hypothetical protein